MSELLSDGDAKIVLRKWPTIPTKWSSQTKKNLWFRAQPIPLVSPGYASPWLSTPGADIFTTQPDGLWASFPKSSYCDLIAVEVCRQSQNLHDKRSRYVHTSYSLLLNCELKWMEEEVAVKNTRLPRWQLADLKKPRGSVRSFPVRYLSVLFALPNALYDKWCAQIPPLPHEFYCPHSSLASYNSQKMQEFLRRMSIEPHFYKSVAPLDTLT